MLPLNVFLRPIFITAFSILGLLSGHLMAQAMPPAKKLVLIAGKKSHGPGEHEYLKTVRLLKVMLDRTSQSTGITTEIHANGWPSDPSTLDNADAIFIYADGSDFNLAQDPIFAEDHWSQLEKQMKRGCGLVLMHYSTFAPATYGPAFQKWVGGYFDYESGKPGASGNQAWYSAITTETAQLLPAPHPITQGVAPFQLHEEFYYKIHFQKNDTRLKPVLMAQLSKIENPQTVAWAVERADGGRGFGFTGGHFYAHWQDPNYRKLLLNALVWTAKGILPKQGIDSVFYTDAEVDAYLK
ncbi:ThuA domain-containing protein [Siphonobacter sp. SORGH_AS_1065]|uniref:ThuA domain-containing protein n=1 Tax=Siphonobacter sp. SORGH_AS_1065 TaxID=3041795 RepID=UPI002785C9AD|nr:ThuA domain-containing protein [Siphonobacter sp. SORGH_AS_1065]MDQ1085537.1 type 1 glutamine amidotransferase [Siphonobacter sp. SORGH_AS_1065]